MRLPTSYGSVYKLSGKRRRPWIVRVTTGWTDDGKQQRSIIGYYTTKTEALTALSNYNTNPYDTTTAFTTFKQCYDKWSAEHFEKVSESNVKGYKASYKLCESFENIAIKDIKLDMLQDAADKSGKNAPTLKKYKILLGLVFEWAVRHDIIPPDKRQIVSYLEIAKYGNPNKIDRAPFSKSEIDLLWTKTKDSFVIEVVLMMIYSGVRIGELLDLKNEDVNIDEQWIFIRQSKTDAGVRYIPIADKTLPFFKKFYGNGKNEYLIHTDEMSHFEYRNFKDSYWLKSMDHLRLNHLPHDTRHTFISLMTAAGVDERLLKKIAGHKGQNITEAVYTHIDHVTALNAVNLI